MIHKIIFVIDSSNLLYPEGKQMNEYSPIEYIKENEGLPPLLVMSGAKLEFVLFSTPI